MLPTKEGVRHSGAFALSFGFGCRAYRVQVEPGVLRLGGALRDQVGA